MNPELSYTTQFFGNFDNIFAGQKKDDSFSIYLYRPITRGMRTEILAKGSVLPVENGIEVHVRYEIPFWSILAFVFLGGFAFLTFYINSGLIIGSVVTGLFLLIYVLILNANHNAVKNEILAQFKKIRDQAK